MILPPLLFALLASTAPSSNALSAALPNRHVTSKTPSPTQISLFKKQAIDDVQVDGKNLLDDATASASTSTPNSTSASTRTSLLHKILRLNNRKQDNTIRGGNYGAALNGTHSTILTPDLAAQKVGVRPTAEASKATWQRAWKLHKFMIKYLLHVFDRCGPKDSKLSLACLWWKAIAGNDATSPVYDSRLSYDLLPPVTRWLVHPRLCRLYPRLHHANVEIRTAYLDRSLNGIIHSICAENRGLSGGNTTMENAIASTSQSVGGIKKNVNDNSTYIDPSHAPTQVLPINSNTDVQTSSCNLTGLGASSLTAKKDFKPKIRLIVMGGGYDTRSFKFMERHLSANSSKDLGRHLLRHERRIQRQRQSQISPFGPPAIEDTVEEASGGSYELECFELDLPVVVEAKRKLLQSRLYRRRPWLRKAKDYPTLVAVDFNDLDETRRALEDILLTGNRHSTSYSRERIETVILFEGVMIYLDPGIPHSLLQLCSDVLGKRDAASGGGYLCFADRLENIPGGDEDLARIEMENTGWELMDFLSKPGLARHMGVARLRR